MEPEPAAEHVVVESDVGVSIGKCKSGSVEDLIKDMKHKSVKQILNEAGDCKIEYTRGIEEDGIIKENRSYRGFVYERLWDICIKFGVVDYLTMKNNETDDYKEYNTCHLFGNLNRENIDYEDKCWSGQFEKYLGDNIQSGNSGGYSDISFVNQYKIKDEDGKWIEKEDIYFISVKYYEKEKGVGDYDIGKLCTLIEKHKGKHGDNRTIHILIFVKDKEDVIKKFNKQQKSSDIMMKYIDPKGDGNFPNIYDEKDLEQAITKLKLLLEQYNYLEDEISRTRFSVGEDSYLQILKSPFVPRFHQKLFIDKINELILKDGEKNILVGAIPRSGKSYIMMGSIIEYVKEMNKFGNTRGLNFILVTPAPNETFGEYDDIYNSYIDFDNLDINCIKLKSGKTNIRKELDKKKHNLFIVSKQMLGYKEGNETSKTPENQNIQIIKKTTEERVRKLLDGDKNFDLILLDEAHFGMSTENAQEILNVLEGLGKNTPKLFVTATYNKPLSVYGIDAEKCKLTWDINDIQMFKDKGFNIKDNPIRDRYGHRIYDHALDYFDNDSEKIIKSYEMYPKPYLMTSIWDYQYLQQEKDKIDMDSYGFDMDKLFTVQGGRFSNQDQMIQMMRYYFGYPDKKLSYGNQHIYRQRGILPRIQKICTEEKCRTMQSPNHYTTQLWFLPYGPNRKIVDIVNALIGLFKHSEFQDITKQFHFYVAVDVKGGKDTTMARYMQDPHNIKNEIQELEKEVKKNIIVLAGARLQLGISLRNVDIVTLWNMVTSSDAIFQMLFRSMTEVNVPRCHDENYFCPEKKYGFMVDLNPQRALTNALLFGENLTVKKSEGKSKYELISDCINIDEDVFHDKYNSEDPNERKEFVNQMFNKLYSSWDKNVDDMRKLTEKVLKYDENALKSIEKNLREIKLPKRPKKKTVQEAEEGFEPGEKGRKVDGESTTDDSGENETKKEKEIKKIPLSQLAAEVITELVSLLNIFSLYTKGDNTGCILTSDISTEDIEEGRQVNIVNDINQLKAEVFLDRKEVFLEILNGRITGDYDNMYDEDMLNIILDSILKFSSEKENNLYAINKLVMSQKKKYYTIREPDKLLEYINDNLSPKETERKQSGEVFTPISIVEEMLDKLPKQVWSDHTLKWLDPAVGIGNFPICVYLRLMEGLKSWKPNEEERREHIIQNMLFMVEISKKSIMILNKVFCGDKYELNIFEGSFVKEKSDGFKVYNPDITFDIIMGNPPYQFSHGTGNPVYQHFCYTSLEKLNNNGILLFIIPVGWKKYFSGDKRETGKIFNTFKNYHIDTLTMNIEIEHFPPVDFFTIIKNKTKKLSKIKCSFNGKEYNSNLYLSELQFIPLLLNDYSLKIIQKLLKKGGEKLFFEYPVSKLPGDRSKTKNEKYKYPYIHLLDSNGIKDKIYLKDKKDIFNGDKIVINVLNTIKDPPLFPYIDKSNHGTTQRIALMKGSISLLNKIKEFLNSKLIRFILKITQYSSGQYKQNEYKILNLITYPDKPLKTDEDIYKYYGITSQEQKLIDEVVNHVKPSKITPKKDDIIEQKEQGVPQEPEIVEEPEPEPMKEPEHEPMKDKECPPGKIINPKTGRCINKPKEKTPKACPPGQELNPKTGRCNKIKTPKKASIRNKASIRKKSTIRKKHKRKNNKRTIRKRGR